MEDYQKSARIEAIISRRKCLIDKTLWSRRLNESSNPVQPKVEEEQEADTGKPRKGYLPVNQYRSHYRKRCRKGKRCWVCKSNSHLKRDCPKLECYYCRKKGHIKKKCIWFELHKAISYIKGTKTANPLEEIKEKKKRKCNKKETVIDRMKKVTFRKDGNDHILVYEGVDLGMYTGDQPIDQVKVLFTRPILPMRLMEKEIKNDMPIQKVKHSTFLPHQCGDDGEVLTGIKFDVHCQTKHRGFTPAHSLVNASPFRYWILWYDEENFLKFWKTRGKAKFTRVPPPWIN